MARGAQANGVQSGRVEGAPHAPECGGRPVDAVAARPLGRPPFPERPAGQGLVVALVYRLFTLLIAALGYFGNRREMAEVRRFGRRERVVVGREDARRLITASTRRTGCPIGRDCE